MEIVGVNKIRRFKSRGYALIKTIIDDYGYQFEMHTAYSWPELQYIGDTKEAYRLWNMFGITEFYPNQEYIPAEFNNNTTDKIKSILRYGNELIPYLRPAKVCSIGWSPSQQKWYGWSHRAIYGFTIGSEVKKGNVAFKPSNKEDFIEDSLSFWDLSSDGSWYIDDSFMKRLVGYKEVQTTDELGVEITDEIKFFGRQEGREREVKTSFLPYPEWGKGEWKAETLEDAKQMAIDFANGIS